MSDGLPKSYRNWKDAEYRRQYAREYSAKLYREGRTWAQSHKDVVKTKRRSRTLSQYQLTYEAWNSLFEEQGKACAICRSTETARFGWATDHDHSTGEVRGILCSNCNTAIGQMKDDPDRLRAAADYLAAYQNKLKAFKKG